MCIYTIRTRTTTLLRQLNKQIFCVNRELKECFSKLKYNNDCRSIVLSANGKGFTAGLDLSDLSMILNPESDDPGRKGFHNKKIIDDWQESMSSPEEVLDFSLKNLFLYETTT